MVEILRPSFWFLQKTVEYFRHWINIQILGTYVSGLCALSVCVCVVLYTVSVCVCPGVLITLNVCLFIQLNNGKLLRTGFEVTYYDHLDKESKVCSPTSIYQNFEKFLEKSQLIIEQPLIPYLL